MEQFKLYSVSDEYVEWLRKDFPKLYSNKISSRTHTRKYLGVVLHIGKYNYYIPMSSPKDSDYQIAGANKVIKKSYDLLGLMSFLTAGEPEVRAWTIKKGTKAPQAAGKIHSDIEKGFIKAEVVSY